MKLLSILDYNFFHQLKEGVVRQMAATLEAIGSAQSAVFKTLLRRVITALAEAQEIALHLKPITKPLDVVQNAEVMDLVDPLRYLFDFYCINIGSINYDISFYRNFCEIFIWCISLGCASLYVLYFLRDGFILLFHMRAIRKRWKNRMEIPIQLLWTVEFLKNLDNTWIKLAFPNISILA